MPVYPGAQTSPLHAIDTEKGEGKAQACDKRLFTTSAKPQRAGETPAVNLDSTP
jgi:hypothetical protein